MTWRNYRRSKSSLSRRGTRSIIGRHFDIVDEDVGEVDSRGQCIGCAHLAVDDEFDVVSAWLEMDCCRESIFMFARPTVIIILVSCIL